MSAGKGLLRSGLALLAIAALGATGATWRRRARERAAPPSEEETTAAVRRAWESARIEQSKAKDADCEQRHLLEVAHRMVEESRVPSSDLVRRISCLRQASIAIDRVSALGVSPREAMRRLAIGKRRLSFNGDDESGFFASLGLARPPRFQRGTFGFVPSGKPATFCVEWSEKPWRENEHELAIPGIVTIKLPGGTTLRGWALLSIGPEGHPLDGHLHGDARGPRGARVLISWDVTGGNSPADLGIVGARGYSSWQSIPAQ